MAKGKKTGGRQPGSLNKANVSAQEIANRLGVDPFEVLLLFAKEDFKTLGYDSRTIEKPIGGGMTCTEFVISPELRQRSAEKACEYLRPKLKAVEVSMNPQLTEKFNELQSKTEEELLAIVKGITQTDSK